MARPAARGGGQALFLSSAQVLKQTLLSAVDLMRFSLASKAISSWVLATQKRSGRQARLFPVFKRVS